MQYFTDYNQIQMLIMAQPSVAGSQREQNWPCSQAYSQVALEEEVSLQPSWSVVVVW